MVMGENEDRPLAAFAPILSAAIRSRRTAIGRFASALSRRSNGQMARSAIALIQEGTVDARMDSLAALRVALDDDLWAVASRLLAECQATIPPTDKFETKKLLESK